MGNYNYSKKNLIVTCFDKKKKKKMWEVFGASYDDFLYYKKKFATDTDVVSYKKIK